jgi:hypothetical protein
LIADFNNPCEFLSSRSPSPRLKKSFQSFCIVSESLAP